MRSIILVELWQVVLWMRECGMQWVIVIKEQINKWKLQNVSRGLINVRTKRVYLYQDLDKSMMHWYYFIYDKIIFIQGLSDKAI